MSIPRPSLMFSDPSLTARDSLSRKGLRQKERARRSVNPIPNPDPNPNHDLQMSLKEALPSPPDLCLSVSRSYTLDAYHI